MLPLRGKILNIERKDEASLYKNTEIQSLITGLGLGMKVSRLQFLILSYKQSYFVIIIALSYTVSFVQG